jgi:hypothetical protein
MVLGFGMEWFLVLFGRRDDMILVFCLVRDITGMDWSCPLFGSRDNEGWFAPIFLFGLRDNCYSERFPRTEI